MRNARRVILLAGLLLAAAAVSGCEPKTDVTGQWVAFVTWEVGDSLEGAPTTLTMSLQQNQLVLDGSVHLIADFMDLSMPIVEGTVGRGYFYIDSAGTAQGSGTSYAIFLSLDGEASGNSLEGSGILTVNGVEHHFEWSARRSS